MSKISDYINTLQKKPLHVRIRILWGTTAVIGILLAALWAMTLKAELNNISNPPADNETVRQETTKYIFVERAQSQDDTLTLYFRVSNQTNDILHFSKLADIKLNVGGTTINPSEMTDRQGQRFVQNVLSRSENFGILVFPIEAPTNGSITFDNLYLETKPENIFRETLDLDLEELEKPQELRN